MKRILYSLLLLLTVQIISGCAERFPKFEIVEPLPAEYSCRIAILPFILRAKYPRGENIFYKTFTSELAAVTDLNVIPEGEVLALYKQLRMYRKTDPTIDQIQYIGQRLQAPLVIHGDILEMKEVDSSRKVQTEMTLLVKIYDSSTGKLLWETYHRRNGDEYQNVLHYGRVNSISGLARRMSNEIITLWIDKGMNNCVQ